MRAEIEDTSKYQALLDYLSEEDKKAMQKDYYETKTSISEILKKYGVSVIDANRVYKCFPNEVSTIKKCSYCDRLLERNAVSRTKLKYTDDIWICTHCGHSTYMYCNCEKCQRSKQLYQESLQIRKRIAVKKELFDTEIIPVNIETLSLTDKVILGSILRGGISSDCERIRSFCEMGAPIFPETTNGDSFFRSLLKRQIICVHKDNDLDKFTMDELTSKIMYDLKKVTYLFNVQKNKSREEAVREILAPQKLDNDKDEILEIWKDIIYLEALSLFLYKMREYNFNYIIGKETELFFHEALEHLTLEELYSIIWKSVPRAAAYSVKNKNISKRQAANSALTIMRSLYEKTMSGNIVRTPYSIPANPAQSLVSQYFFSTFVVLYDKYSSVIPKGV